MRFNKRHYTTFLFVNFHTFVLKSWIVLLTRFSRKTTTNEKIGKLLSITPFFQLKLSSVSYKSIIKFIITALCVESGKNIKCNIILFYHKPILSCQCLCIYVLLMFAEYQIIEYCAVIQRIYNYIYIIHTHKDIYILYKCISVFVLSSSSIICVFVNVWCSYYKCAASFISFFILIINEGKKTRPM